MRDRVVELGHRQEVLERPVGQAQFARGDHPLRTRSAVEHVAVGDAQELIAPQVVPAQPVVARGVFPSQRAEDRQNRVVGHAGDLRRHGNRGQERPDEVEEPPDRLHVEGQDLAGQQP